MCKRVGERGQRTRGTDKIEGKRRRGESEREVMTDQGEDRLYERVTAESQETRGNETREEGKRKVEAERKVPTQPTSLLTGGFHWASLAFLFKSQATVTQRDRSAVSDGSQSCVSSALVMEDCEKSVGVAICMGAAGCGGAS
jgi:hypothetical protein